MVFRPKNTKRGGYSLVEVLIAITILLISIIGPFTIAATGLKNASFAKQQNTAFFLAQEGLEAVVKVREDSALYSYTYGAVPFENAWSSVEDFADGNKCENDPCGIDIGESIELFLCSESGKTCDLYLDDNGRYRYSHNSAGEETEYRREIYLDVNEDRAYIRSEVSWGSDPDQRVELATYVYNIYEN